ncbi:DUF4034 domain-containing protein [Amycolatopsis suaedae]|uniref:DUF4034 domain-containing protein n=1 Tax=Amycolatopsis suaedae TaxID=2510978 RepID=A0A4Q7JE70_9PSEU|nr:DUF4034 domain-containing protein [Amycolatopsis suaedae]RZQ65402.1 DUF4034 domain-containing protein [Amycolatopsis suaedae]
MFTPRDIRILYRMSREARRRGISAAEFSDTMTDEDALRLAMKPVDPARWGLPPDDDITADVPPRDPRLAEVVAAARKSQWEPAAALLAGHGADWERRAVDVETLADVAVDVDWLETWRAARPGDPHAATVHARMLVTLAWKLRGARLARQTSAEQFAGFFRTLDAAEEATTQAIDAAPDDPTPWWTMVTLARGQQMSHDRFRRIWAGLLARAPLHRYGHDQALQYWCDKWAGTHERMFDFAEASAAKDPSLSSLPVQACYEYVIREEKPIWRSRRARLALDNLLDWLAGAGAGSIHEHHDRSIAALGLTGAGRHDEAVEQFRLLGRRADSWAWSYSTDARLKFLTTRWDACKKARRPSR